MESCNSNIVSQVLKSIESTTLHLLPTESHWKKGRKSALFSPFIDAEQKHFNDLNVCESI